MNLVSLIRDIEGQISERRIAYKKSIAPLEDALKAMRAINTACEKCGGKGSYFYRSCAEDDGMVINCRDCNGTGLKR
jgi:hypothetical protein